MNLNDLRYHPRINEVVFVKGKSVPQIIGEMEFHDVDFPKDAEKGKAKNSRKKAKESDVSIFSFENLVLVVFPNKALPEMFVSNNPLQLHHLFKHLKVSPVNTILDSMERIAEVRCRFQGYKYNPPLTCLNKIKAGLVVTDVVELTGESMNLAILEMGLSRKASSKYGLELVESIREDYRD